MILLNRDGCIFIFHKLVPCEMYQCTLVHAFLMCNLFVCLMYELITLIDVDFLRKSAINVVPW